MVGQCLVFLQCPVCQQQPGCREGAVSVPVEGEAGRREGRERVRLVVGGEGGGVSSARVGRGGRGSVRECGAGRCLRDHHQDPVSGGSPAGQGLLPHHPGDGPRAPASRGCCCCRRMCVCLEVLLGEGSLGMVLGRPPPGAAAGGGVCVWRFPWGRIWRKRRRSVSWVEGGRGLSACLGHLCCTVHKVSKETMCVL